MGGVPDIYYCSICESIRTDPPKSTVKVFTEARSAWCSFHQRRLSEPGLNTALNLSRMVCAEFTSVYTPGKGYRQRYPRSPILIGDNANYLWRVGPSDVRPVYLFEPLVRIEYLPKVDPETGDVVNP